MEILLLVFLGLTAWFFLTNRSDTSNHLANRSDSSADLAGSSDTSNDKAPPVVIRRQRRPYPTPQASMGPVLVSHKRSGAGFVESLARAAMQAAGTMVTVAAVAVGTVVIGTAVAAYAAAGVIRSVLDEYRRGGRNTDAARERASREREVREVNSLIFELEEKRARDGRLNPYDAYELDGLYRNRDERAALLVGANGLVIADQMSARTGTYDNLHVTDVNTHVLQFHVGQAVFGKSCSRCGMPMVLQWRQHLESVRMADFFWGCAGFYGGTCRNVERFGQADMDLFTRTDREEFTIDTRQLSVIARQPEAVRVVRRRMNEIVNEPNSTYYCPVHHEPMVLRRKKGAETLRDLYFYGCPRWRPAGVSCGQMVKLKSAAQLSAVLETATGRGIL